MPVKQTIILILLLSATTVYSQGILKNVSIEAFGGLANYQGELQENTYTFSQAKPAGALGASYALTDKISLRGLITYGHIQAEDSYSSSIQRRKRNLSFYSKIYDASLTGVYEFFDIMEKRYTPYLFAGVSVFNMGPYTFDSLGNKIGLQDLGTEGQGLPEYPGRKNYKHQNISIPFGGGIRFAVTRNVSLGWEFRFNKTFTDYLDDVSSNYVLDPGADIPTSLGQIMANRTGGDPSHGNGQQRGDRTDKDWYIVAGFNLSYILPTNVKSPKFR